MSSVDLIRTAAQAARDGLQVEANLSDDPLAYLPTIRWLKERLTDLDQPDRRAEAQEQLTVWLRIPRTGHQ